MSEPDVSELVSVARAIEIIDGVPVSPRIVDVALADADGMRLAEDVRADRDAPPFDRSMMDGFAVRSADVGGASPGAPVSLRIVGEVRAGENLGRKLRAGEAAAIMTGAPVPPGADAVVPVEFSRRAGDAVYLTTGAKPGRSIAPRASEVAAGAVVLPAGALLTPAAIAVAASVGATRLRVCARPRAVVLSTGDELTAVDIAPGDHQIRNSNGPMLVSLLRRLGCDVTDHGIVRDDRIAIRDALLRGLRESDVLFVSGGMSMGDRDYVPKLLLELGVDLRVTKVRIRPGKPFVFGVAGGGVADAGGRASGARGRVSGVGIQVSDEEAGANSAGNLTANPESGPRHADPATRNPGTDPHNPVFVFGLPGNPVSGFVCTVRLAARLLARFGGGSGANAERWASGPLRSPLPVNGPRESHQPCVADVGDGGVTPLAWNGSADTFTLARANALLVRDEGDRAREAGDVVRALMLP